eukprot:6968998-Prymnesium_polylepis.1
MHAVGGVVGTRASGISRYTRKSSNANAGIDVQDVARCKRCRMVRRTQPTASGQLHLARGRPQIVACINEWLLESVCVLVTLEACALCPGRARGS